MRLLIAIFRINTARKLCFSSAAHKQREIQKSAILFSWKTGRIYKRAGWVFRSIFSRYDGTIKWGYWWTLGASLEFNWALRLDVRGCRLFGWNFEFQWINGFHDNLSLCEILFEENFCVKWLAVTQNECYLMMVSGNFIMFYFGFLKIFFRLDRILLLF